MTEQLNMALALDMFLKREVNQQVARICVWAVHHDKLEEGLRLCTAQGCKLGEDDMYEVAVFFKKVWQIDVPREVRKTCFLCNDDLPQHFERLCQCFREAQVARFIDPTPDNIEFLKEQYPGRWAQKIVETILCQSCGCLARVEAGVVDSKFRKGKHWNTPKFCQKCYNGRKNERDQRQTSASRKIHSSVEMKDSKLATLRDLQEKLQSASPPVAES